MDDLIDIYIKQVRSVIEFGVPVWNPGLTKDEMMDIERVQKAFLHIALGTSYGSYEDARTKSNLETLEDRRTQICIQFATKAAKYPKHKHWFVPSDTAAPDTRSQKLKFKPLFLIAQPLG